MGAGGLALQEALSLDESTQKTLLKTAYHLPGAIN
jgi:hypothetical protein